MHTAILAAVASSNPVSNWTSNWQKGWNSAPTASTPQAHEIGLVVIAVLLVLVFMGLRKLTSSSS